MSICTDTGLVAEQAIERSEWSRPGVMWTNGPSTADGITVEEHSCCLEKESCCLVKGECLPQTSVDGLCSSDTVARDVAVVGGCVETVRTVSTLLACTNSCSSLPCTWSSHIARTWHPELMVSRS